MERKEYLVQPRIAAYIMELQLQHALPVNIIVGEIVDGLKLVTFEYELINYNLVLWMIDKGNQYYTGLPAEVIMDDND